MPRRVASVFNSGSGAAEVAPGGERLEIYPETNPASSASACIPHLLPQTNRAKKILSLFAPSFEQSLCFGSGEKTINSPNGIRSYRNVNNYIIRIGRQIFASRRPTSNSNRIDVLLTFLYDRFISLKGGFTPATFQFREFFLRCGISYLPRMITIFKDIEANFYKQMKPSNLLPRKYLWVVCEM